MQHYEMQKIAVRCHLELELRGIELRVVQDLDEVVDLFKVLDKSPSRANDPKRILLTRSNSFSVFCFEDGNPIMGFMVRVDDLGDEDAQSFLRRSVETIFGVQVTKTRSELYKGRMWGRAAYFGDLKTVSSNVSNPGKEEKDTGISPKLGRVIRFATGFAHFHAMDHFGSQMNYCFLRKSDERNAVPYGFLENDAFVWETNETLYPDGSPSVVAQLSRVRLPSAMYRMSEFLPDLVAVDKKPRLQIIGQDAASSS